MNFKTCFMLIMRILPITLFSSCELTKDIDYETTFDAPKIIVHGFINEKDGAQVIIKKTVDPNKINDDDRITNASVLLIKNSRDSILLKKASDYLYVTDSVDFMSIGNSYTISAKCDDIKGVTSNLQTLLNAPRIDSVNLLIDVTYYSSLVLHFRNFYSEKESFYLNVIYYLDGEIVEVMSRYEKFNPFAMLSNIDADNNSVEYPTGHASYFDSLKVELYVLSDDLSRFLTSQKNYDYSKEDPFYAQTYPVYSNISGGYGIFASYAYSSTTVCKPNED